MIAVTRQLDLPYAMSDIRTVLEDLVDGLRCNPEVKYLREAPASGPHLRWHYNGVERIGPLRLSLDYRIERLEPGRALVMRGRSRLLRQVDILILRQLDEGGTRITRHIQIYPRGPVRLAQKWLKRHVDPFIDEGTRALARLLDRELAATLRRRPAAQRGLTGALARLPLRR